MKKVVVLLLILIFCATNTFAAQLYVKSMRAKVLSKPSLKSKIVGIAKRGAIVEEVKKQGKWIEVKYKTTKGWKKGWVSKYLLSTRPPMKRVSLLARGENLQKTSRRRASAFTSVAAARGLTDYDRARRGRKGYDVDFAALDRMDKINISEDEALKFIEQGVSR
ncbi:MAG: SH3 domain-containing protein [bacterium]|nr:SH3 domain-containing protein [bacterium]